MIYIHSPDSIGFEWDAHNVAHIARHGLQPTEVEQALTGEPATLLEEFVKGGERVRVVTAYPANRRLRRDYERAKSVGNDPAPGTDSQLQD